MVRDMEKVFNASVVKRALTKQGWTQADLARSVDVSSQSVTNWMKGEGFPRPATLLKLALQLKLNFDELVKQPNLDEPIIAFRKKAGTKTKDHHYSEARDKGLLLGRLAKYIKNTTQIRAKIANPTTEYEPLQALASEVRKRIKLGATSVLKYNQLISEFKSNGSILIPTLWGERKSHANALHILLPKTDLTFIFLNLDTRPEDFKFWMAHELAHVYTPNLSGTDEGEDFADAFAGALLFPKGCAENAYSEIRQVDDDGEMNILKRYAKEYNISLYSVFQETNKFAEHLGVPILASKKVDVHKVRSQGKMIISQCLFDHHPPEPMEYISVCEREFDTTFFNALRQMISDGIEYPYVQQVLGVSKLDSMAIHQELAS